VLQQEQVSRASLADNAGLDRSAISQLLREKSTALPNGHSLALIAKNLNVSADWLLGLSDDPRPTSQVMEQAVTLTKAEPHPLDSNIINWHLEALGQKIRYIRSTLPAPMKTPATINHEFDLFRTKSPDQARYDTEEKLSFFRHPESELEIALAKQTLIDFAEGNGIWRGLSVADRAEQLKAIGDYCQELYPSIRMHIFDARALYSAPITVFGHQRATVYLGQRYFVFPKGERVTVLAKHFDELVRGACVTSDHAADWFYDLAKLTAHLRDGDQLPDL